MLINRIKKFFFKENFNQKQIKIIVENIIQISDSEIFYKKYKIPRNFSSKFEIIILFIFLIFNRFKNDKNSEIKLQQIYDFLFDYVDSSLREVGVGDLSVGKKVIELAKIFSFRIKAYDKSFENNLSDIKKPIKRYIYKNSYIKSLEINHFVKYILTENKKLQLSPKKNIFIKNYFKLPQ